MSNFSLNTLIVRKFAENSHNNSKPDFEPMAAYLSSPPKVMQMGPSLAQQGGMATVQNLLLDMDVAGFQLFHIATHDEGSVSHRLGIFARALWECSRTMITDRQIKIAHLHMAERGSVLRVMILVALLSAGRKKIVVHTHGAEFREFYEAQFPWVQKIIALMLRRCDRCIVLSDSWREYYATMLKIAPCRISVFHNPVQIPARSRPQPAPPAAPFQFVFLGRIGERKGTFKLLEAFAQLRQNPNPSRLTLAGDGEVAAAQALATTLGVHDRVDFPGWLDQSDVSTLLSKANAFVLPSLNEGLPMSILEAMSWRLPVIASAVGGIPEVVIPMQTGLLVDPHNPDTIAQAMQCLVDYPALAEALGTAAYEQVQEFSSLNYQQKLSQLYEELVP